MANKKRKQRQWIRGCYKPSRKILRSPWWASPSLPHTVSPSGKGIWWSTLRCPRTRSSTVAPPRSGVPFSWTINPYRGCEFGLANHCYARYTHEFMEMRDGVDFERKIYVKQQTAWLLRQELRKVKRGEEIAIGTATDPYQPAEKRFEITRGILEELALHQGLQIGIVSKSELITRDIDLLQRVAEGNTLYINLTDHDRRYQAGAHSGAASAAPRSAVEGGSRAAPGRAAGGSDLRAGAAGYHRLACRSGCTGASNESGGWKIHLRQPAVSEAMLGEGVSAVPGKRVSSPGGGISQALRGPRVSGERLRQAHLGADGPPAQEARHHARGHTAR